MTETMEVIAVMMMVASRAITSLRQKKGTHVPQAQDQNILLADNAMTIAGIPVRVQEKATKLLMTLDRIPVVRSIVLMATKKQNAVHQVEATRRRTNMGSVIQRRDPEKVVAAVALPRRALRDEVEVFSAIARGDRRLALAGKPEVADLTGLDLIGVGQSHAQTIGAEGGDNRQPLV